MSDTVHLGLPYLAAAQAQKHVTHNEALSLIDGLMHLAVKSRGIATPPSTPAQGDRYLVAASSTGLWAGKAGTIALYTEGAWWHVAPREGWYLWVDDEDVGLTFDGSDWSMAGIPTTLQDMQMVGINATADATNKLSVSSAATLFNNAGEGHQLKINKAADADTASLLFQTGFSGRAEFGTTGDDDFHIKVSSNGSTYNEALVVDASSGLVTAKNTLRFEPQAADPAFPVDGQVWYNSTSGVLRVRQAGASINLGATDIPGFPALATPASTDQILLHDDSAANHVRITLADALKVVNDLAETSLPDVLNDEVLIYDTSEVAARRTAPRDLGFMLDRARGQCGFYFFTDFLQETSTTGTDNSLQEVNSGTGVATTAIATTAANVVGVAQSSTGTTSSGRAALVSSTSALRFGGGEWFFEAAVAVPVQSTATERFQFAVGFIDTATSINQVDGVFFLYDEGGVSTGAAASPNWQCVSASNNVRTRTTSGVAVGTGFVRLGIEVNAAGTSVAFYINGVLAATHTANIPVGAGRETGFGGALFKSIGATARTVNYDYVLATCRFTTPR